MLKELVKVVDKLKSKHEFKPTLVKKGATIGANATIICGNTIGRYGFIGAGAIVTKGIPDYAMVYGNPARLQGWVCECGVKLDFARNNIAKCSRCGRKYKKQEKEKETIVERL